MNALDAAIVAFIEADDDTDGMSEPEVGAVGGVHQGVAPQGTPFPRYVFSEVDDLPAYSFAGLVADHMLYQLTVQAQDDIVVQGESQATEREGVFTAGRLIERARTKFTDPDGLIISGKTIMYCRFQRNTVPQFTKDANQDRYIYSKGLLLELWLA
jgi:hypothetical protein